MKTVMLTARIDPDIKGRAENILHELGISTTQAISMYFSQIILNKGMPFRVEIPNYETAQAIDDAFDGIDVHEVTDLDKLRKELNS